MNRARCLVLPGIARHTGGSHNGIHERARHDLFVRLGQVLGPAEATTLMEHLPPVGWADVATKRDLETLEHKLRAELSEQLNHQTRTMLHAIVFSTASSVLTVGALAFAAARLV